MRNVPSKEFQPDYDTQFSASYISIKEKGHIAEILQKMALFLTPTLLSPRSTSSIRAEFLVEAPTICAAVAVLDALQHTSTPRLCFIYITSGQHAQCLDLLQFLLTLLKRTFDWTVSG